MKKKSSQRTGVVSPPRARLQGSDAIAKLKKMNSNLQKSYHEQPVMHNQPFIPSSTALKNPLSPNSPISKHKYWYGVERSRSPHGKKSNGDYDAFYSEASPQPRGAQSEYDESYVQMKLPERPPRSPERPLTSLSNFMVDANTSTWKSEQHDNFRNLPIGGTVTCKVAGVSTKDKDTYPASFAWNLTHKGSELNKKDPTSTKGEHVDEDDVGKQSHKDDRISEHDQKFLWPPAAERVIYTNPYKQFTPFPKDVSHINAVNWKSEYDDINTKLATSKAAKDMAQDSVAAGVANLKLDKANPTFYAWEKDQAPQRNDQVPPETHDPHYPYNYNMGNTEHKNKYKEWPLEEVSHTENVNAARQRATGTQVFPPSKESDYAELRQTSTHKHDYPKYSDREVSSAAAPSGPIVREKPPISFAWSTLEQENADYVPPHRHRETNGLMEDTEYARKFNWPPQEALQHPVHRKDSTSSSEMQATLAHGHIGVESSDHLKSEYQKEYVEKQANFIPSPQLSPSKSRPSNPPQFAWSLVNGQPLHYEDEDDHGKTKPRKPLVNDKELSEHTAKFRWPTVNEHLHGHKPLDEMNKHGSIYAIDPEDMNPAKWQSEYDEKCATLRKKQQALKSSMIAGKPTQAREQVPANFAWTAAPMPPPPPPVESGAAYKPRHVNPDHFHSEYEEKFLPWHMEKNEAKHHDGERLNLFADDQYSAGTSVTKGMKTEYDAQFNAKDGLVLDHVYFKPNRNENIPPQFAWPLDADSLPQPPPKPVKQTAPLEKTEYETNFTWHTAPPSKPVKRANNEAPIAIDDDQPESVWKTEYDANAEKAAKVGKEGSKAVPPAAGLIAIKNEDVPSFFAWADAEEKKAPVLPQPPAFPAEVVPTEYQERFQPTNITAENKPQRFKEPQNPDWFHIEKGNSSFATEYDSKFQWKTAPATSRFQESSGAVVATGNQASVPHQFAWSLIDGTKPRSKSAPPRTSTIPFKETSEYESKFKWSPEDYQHPRQVTKTNQVDHFHAAASLRHDSSKDDITAQWESEYDDRCEQLRKKQQEVMASTGATVDSSAATVSNMKATVESNKNPPFFAWQENNRETELIAEERKNRRPQIPTETTEYREKFSSSNGRPSTPTSILRSSNSAVFGGNHLTVSRQKFDGQSEYDSRFSYTNGSDAMADALQQSGIHRAIMREKQHQPSLRNTILDLESYQPAEPVVTTSRIRSSSPSKRGAQSGFATEQSDRFVWPEARQSQQSYENAATQKHLMRTTASQSTILPGGMVNQAVTSKMSSLPLTESQQKFSWPDPAKLPQHEPQLSPRKKSLMKNALQNGVKRYSLMKKAPSANVYRKDRVPVGGSHLYNNTFSRSQQMHPQTNNSHSDKHQRQTSSQHDHDDNFSIPSDLQHPYNESNRLASTTGTVMSQDSLHVPSGPKDTNNNNKKNAEPASPVSVADSVTMESKTVRTESDVARKEIFARDNSPIRGLRTDSDMYRSRSAPAKQRLGQALSSDSGLKYRVYRDESPSNPVLMHRRYPNVTDRQATRWATETSDSFRWRNTRTSSPLK